MARTKATAVPKSAKMPAVKKTSTPKRTPSRAKKALMRDLHSLSDLVEQRMGNIGKLCEGLAGLKEKVNVISLNVEEAQKEHDERVGKVERDILQYKLKRVREVLKDTNKVVIDNFEMSALEKLKKECEATNEKDNQDLDGKVSERVAELVRFKEVEFQNKYAESLAKQAAMDAERKTLQATIASLRFEIESQKCLSSDIAKANQQKKINELRRKAIEEMNAKEQAKEEAMLRSQMMMSGVASAAPVAPAAAAPAPVVPASAAATPPLPKPAKKPSGKKSTPCKKTPAKQPTPPPQEESEGTESDSGSMSVTSDEETPVKQTQETPKLKRSGSQLTRTGSATKKPAAKKAKK